ncbi:MAG TPA: class I SAM-dependent methyltransferase [Terriglobales bacterium]|nr:class I SAM-dependent methyltransferase [Terriglobales bacterium]
MPPLPTDYWSCPDHAIALEAAPDHFLCRQFGHRFPIVEGIPCFADLEALAEVQRSELKHREREVAYEGDRRIQYERRIELEAVVGRLRLTAADRVLDAGCGVGRITRALLTAPADVVAVDFSHARLAHLREAVAPTRRLTLATADVTRLPFAAESFSVIVHTQVLEHIPTPEARVAMLRSFRRLLRPGGTLCLTVYNFSEPWRRRGDAKEGRHDSGIFYHCYTADELRSEIEAQAQLKLRELCGVVNLFPHTFRAFPWLGPLARRIDHWGERRPALSQKWGHLLLARATRES